MSSSSASTPNHALLEIGAQCALPGCLHVDFLPIKCACGRVFCRAHIFPDDHTCAARPATSTPTVGPSIPLTRCAFAGCDKPSLHAFAFDDGGGAAPSEIAALCPRCRNGFCASHRYPDAHACTSPVLASSSSATIPEAGRALLAKHFPASNTPRVRAAAPARALPTDPAKRAQALKVELLKARHTAVPADRADAGKSVRVDQRLHVRVQLADSTAAPRYFWFRKAVGTGRAVDMLAAQFQVSTAAGAVTLTRTGEVEPLGMAEPLADQIADGEHLTLTRAAA